MRDCCLKISIIFKRFGFKKTFEINYLIIFRNFEMNQGNLGEKYLIGLNDIL